MTTITPDMLKVIATVDRIAKRMGGRFVPADTGETEAQEAAMQDDVAIAKVARAIMLARGGCNVTDWNERTWNPAIQQVWDMARAGMAATREIDAEAWQHLADYDKDQDAALIRALIERERAGGERAQIVAWLRGDEAFKITGSVFTEDLADAIAAGAHIAIASETQPQEQPAAPHTPE